MFIILFILFIGIPLIKEELENQSYRNECIKRGYDTYWSTDGLRYTSTNKKVYKQHLNHYIIYWYGGFLLHGSRTTSPIGATESILIILNVQLLVIGS